MMKDVDMEGEVSAEVEENVPPVPDVDSGEVEKAAVVKVNFFTALLNRLGRLTKKKSTKEKIAVPPGQERAKPAASSGAPSADNEKNGKTDGTARRWGGRRRKVILTAAAAVVIFAAALSLLLFFSPEPKNAPSSDPKGIKPLSEAERGLFQAIRDGDTEKARAALNADASVYAIDRFGINTMRSAIALNRLDVVRELLAAGYDESEGDDAPALLYAIVQNKPDIVRVLLTPGTRDKARNGYTPLIHAINRGLVETVREILDAGADANIPDKYGYTPLVLAVKNGRAEIVAMLIQAGADTSARSPEGESVLEMAQKRNRAIIAGLLMTAERSAM